MNKLVWRQSARTSACYIVGEREVAPPTREFLRGDIVGSKYELASDSAARRNGSARDWELKFENEQGSRRLLRTVFKARLHPGETP